jgi:hypothetical protein
MSWCVTSFHTHSGRRHCEEDRILREIFGPRREKVVGNCRIFHIENLNDFYSSLDDRFSVAK